MIVIEDIAKWRALRPTLSGSVGFVPTMGALHDGHASLLEASVARDDVTVLSIYVNPTQFNDPKDLANYPDTLQDDLAVARAIGVDYVILPRYADMYADDYRYQVIENQFSNDLCGGNRPGHFTGVLTVVMKLLNLVRPQRAYFGKKDYQQYLLVRDMVASFFTTIVAKLFNIVRPDIALFGEKDFQQLSIVRKMVADLNFPVEIIGAPTVREADGVAMSSRNKLLTPQARRLAGKFNLALRSDSSDAKVRDDLTALGFQVDYVETRGDRRFGAIVVDCGDHTVRLIDNVPANALAQVA